MHSLDTQRETNIKVVCVVEVRNRLAINYAGDDEVGSRRQTAASASAQDNANERFVRRVLAFFLLNTIRMFRQTPRKQPSQAAANDSSL